MNASAGDPANPLISVGLLEGQPSIELELLSGFVAGNDKFAAGRYRFECRDGAVCTATGRLTDSVTLTPSTPDATFALTAAVGHQFHWSEAETQRFDGALRLVATTDGLTVINDVALETYLSSVVCSEMAADCPQALIEAHSVISRSWLLAQRAARARGQSAGDERDRKLTAEDSATIMRWYDQSAHHLFDVCAEDHCQRYHGLGRITTDTVRRAIERTRGRVLEFNGEYCDTRYSKCCGGLTEDARVAWSDDAVPFLVSLFDGEPDRHVKPLPDDERAFAEFLNDPPDAFCRCDQAQVLDLILPERDRRTTPDFFRWRETLSAEQVSDFVRDKLGLELGRIVALEPVSRGASGRLWQLRIVGDKGVIVVGKELEIRRVLSATHLLSSAFLVEPRGPVERPDAFVLHGAGWGHGVGLCQIGAAIMATRGYGYERILAHYFPGTSLGVAR